MKVNLKKKKSNFTMLSNIIIQDSTISLKAKGMSLIIAHFPDDWVFIEETMQNYTSDARTAISNSLKELEKAGYLKRCQLREKGKFSNKIWIFSDEGLSDAYVNGILSECRKPDIGFADIGKSTTTNTHSRNTKEEKKKNTQKKPKKKSFYDFVNILKASVEQYPNLIVKFEGTVYGFEKINGSFLIKDYLTNQILSKIVAEKLYQKMANSLDVEIIRSPL